MRTLAIFGVALGLVAVGGCKKSGGVGLDVDMDPPSVTTAETQRFSGQVRGVEPSLTLNGQPVPVKDGRFETTQPLKAGDNVFAFTLSARPQAGAAVEQKTERYEVKRVDQATFDAQHFYSGSGSVSGSSRKSSSGLLADGAELKVKLQELRGVHMETLKLDGWKRRGDLPLELSLGVGQGRVKVSVKSSEGPVASVVATPGAPVTLKASAERRSAGKKATLRMEALDGPARDVELEVRY